MKPIIDPPDRPQRPTAKVVMTETLRPNEFIGLIREKEQELIELIAEITRMQLNTLANMPFAGQDSKWLEKQASVQEAIRWTGIGKDQIQQGIMALNRSLYNQRYFNQPKE